MSDYDDDEGPGMHPAVLILLMLVGLAVLGLGAAMAYGWTP